MRLRDRVAEANRLERQAHAALVAGRAAEAGLLFGEAADAHHECARIYMRRRNVVLVVLALWLVYVFVSEVIR